MSKIVWILVGLLILARIFLFQPVEVQGSSMMPTEVDGNRWIVEEVTPRVRKETEKFNRGDIVVYCVDANSCNLNNPFSRIGKTFYIKRVVGLPGETIEFRGSKTIIYNKEFPGGAILKENYVSDSVKAQLDSNNDESGKLQVKIPDDSYYILGDNRTNSKDSREIGPVNENKLLGKVWLKFWPFNSAEVFKQEEYSFEKLDETNSDLIYKNVE